MMNFTPELIAKAKAAKSAEELIAIAKENNVELTAEQAKTYFEQLTATGVVADDELEIVAGGACGDNEEECYSIVSLPEKTFVEVINGKCCDKCKGTKGYAKSLAVYGYSRGSVGIYCAPCDKMILTSVKKSDVRLL